MRGARFHVAYREVRIWCPKSMVLRAGYRVSGLGWRVQLCTTALLAADSNLHCFTARRHMSAVNYSMLPVGPPELFNA